MLYHRGKAAAKVRQINETKPQFDLLAPFYIIHRYWFFMQYTLASRQKNYTYEKNPLCPCALSWRFYY